MSTFHSTQNDLQRVHILDVLGVARQLEAALVDFNLIPSAPDALYLPGRVGPVLLRGGSYWYEMVEEIHTGPINTLNGMNVANVRKQYRYHYQRVENIDDVVSQPWDIVDGIDGLGKLVVSHWEKHLLSRTPYLPERGLKIVHEAVIDEVHATRAFETQLRPRTIEDLVAAVSVLNGQSASALRDDSRYTDMFTYLFDLLNPVRNEVRQFLHGARYSMCEVVAINAFTFQINMKGDYRILEWERKTASGKW